MRIMLICSGGMSTGILMRRMQKWADEKQMELVVHAFGIGSYEEEYLKYDCVLIGPQISYKLNEIKSKINIPIDTIESFDYAIGNVENIMKQVKKMLD